MAASMDPLLSCSYVEDGFAATYALGALDGDEAEVFAAHLPTCPACQAEVASLGAVVDHLGLAVDELAPPPAPRARLLAAARSERVATPGSFAPPAVTPDGPRPARETTAIGAPRRIRAAPWGGGTGAYALAAVLLLGISLGLLGWNFLLQREAREATLARDRAQAELLVARQKLAQARSQLATWNLAPTGGQTGTGTLLYLPQQQQAIVVVNGLPPLPPGRVYQLWLIQNGTPSGAGIFSTPTGETALRVDLSRYQMVAITIEPGPAGSPAPTSPPILTGAVGQ